jgi:hypothetical protein
MSQITNTKALLVSSVILDPEVLRDDEGQILSVTYRVDPEYTLSLKTADGFEVVEAIEFVQCEGGFFFYGEGVGDNIIWEIYDMDEKIAIVISPKY